MAPADPKLLLAAATDFANAANEVFELVESTTDLPPETRMKGFGPLIGTKSKAFANFNVTGADFAAARADPNPPPEAREALSLLDSLEKRWSDIITAIEEEVAGLEQASPRIAKGAKAEDIRLPSANGGEWTLSGDLARGTHVLLVVLRHFG